MNFIVRYDKYLFSITFALLMIVHVLNAEKLFLNFHIANSVAAITFLLIAWLRIIAKRLSSKWQLLSLLSFFTTFEVAGFLAQQDMGHVTIENVPLWIIATSVLPLIFNIIVIGSIGWDTYESVGN
jgi:hypothetical protein